MKKLIAPILGFFLIIGCSDAPTGEQPEENQQNNNQAEITEDANQEDVVNENDEIDNETNEDAIEDEPIAKQGGLFEYRPKVGNNMIYTSGDIQLYEYKIIAEDDEHVQVTISIGGDPTTHIYKWTATELTLVYEDAAPTNPETNILNDFKPMPTNKIDILINKEGTADWKLISAADSVTVPFGTFKNVYVIEKITDEVADAETIYRKYYAPGVGFIKETFEVTGKNGYTEEATLEVVE